MHSCDSNHLKNRLKYWYGSMPLLFGITIFTLPLLSKASSKHSDLNQLTRKLVSSSTVGIANPSLSILFDIKSGKLRSIRNVKSGDEYLKNPGNEGNPFRVYVDTTELPKAVTDPGWWSGKVEGAMGGQIVEAGDCSLIRSRFQRSKSGGQLRLNYSHNQSGLKFELDINLPDADNYADCTLTVQNTSQSSHTVLTAFPHFTGLQLGSSRETNLGLMMASYGTPGVKAWMDSGGFYGREVTMQWQAVYEPSRNEGFGFIVMDSLLRPKLIRRFAPSGMSTLYPEALSLVPGGSHTFPTARIIVHRGSWRVVAKQYGVWLQKNIKMRKPASWIKNIDLFVGPWIPDAAAVTKAAETGSGFKSYTQMPDLYLNDEYDLKEWAQYNDGVRANPATYGAYMADGVYEFRKDLGGADAMREGVSKLHRIGRRVMFYIAGNSILKDSPVLAGTNLDRWLLMDKPGHGYDIGYPNGMSVCPGYAPWQDHLAQTAKRILKESGADGIRLDELGSFVPCFNPAHHHRSPLDSNQWLRELVRKVRAAMDEVNPNAILNTEGPIDFLHESCDGALQMFQPGRDIDAMRAALPGYIGFAYHPGAAESALNGWVGGKTTARRVEWPWGHRGLSGPPADYKPGPGPELRWQELRATFPEAISAGEVTLEDPTALDAPNWVGRLWKGKHYWLLIGGALDGSPIGSEVTVQLPDLPASIIQAYEFDASTLAMHKSHLWRDKGRVFIRMTGNFGATLLPLPDCPSLLTMPEALPEIHPGSNITLKVHALHSWSKQVSTASISASCPGILSASISLSIPGILRIHVPDNTLPGFYPLRLSGENLPLKRWIRVVR